MYQLRQNKITVLHNLYRLWQKHQIPAIYYHYTLHLLKNKQGNSQIQLINQETKSLVKNQHPYHSIIANIKARQNSLNNITKILQRVVKGLELQEINKNNIQDQDVNNIIYQSHPPVTQTDFQSQHSRIINYVSHSLSQQQQGKIKRTRSLNKLISHIKSYRILTQKLIISIFEWQKNIYYNGFTDLVQFIYQRQDYFQTMFLDTKEIIQKYSLFFIDNPFLLLQQSLQYTQFESIILPLSLSPKQTNKIQICLQILTNHHSALQQQRILGKIKKTDFSQSLKIKKSKSLAIIKYETPKLTTKNQNSRISRISTQKIIKQKQIKQNSESLISFSDSPYKVSSKQIKKKQISSKNKQVQFQSPIKVNNLQISSSTKQQAFQMQFVYKRGLIPEEIMYYLQKDLELNKHSNSLAQNIATRLLSLSQTICLIQCRSKSSIIGWLAVNFIPKDSLFRKTVQIIYMMTYKQTPNFQEIVNNQFHEKGYHYIKVNNKIIHQSPSLLNKNVPTIQIKFHVNGDRGDLKDVIKQNKNLKNNRILKYYHYSKQTKYHKFCQHSQSKCTLSFYFQQTFKITILKNKYIMAKCYKIVKISHTYFIYHQLNSLVLVIGKKIDQILQNIDDHSLQQGQQIKKQYICLPQTKSLIKYHNFSQRILSTYCLIFHQGPQIISIDKKHQDKNFLIFNRPFTICFYDQKISKKIISIMQLP